MKIKKTKQRQNGMAESKWKKYIYTEEYFFFKGKRSNKYSFVVIDIDS